MKILYLSCHSILEYDEIKLLHELGHEVFSPGAYFDPSKPPDEMRPGVEGLVYDPDIVEQYNRIGAANPGKDGKEHLTKEFVDNFDVTIVMHVPKWILCNRNAFQGNRVVWRTIGQSIAPIEDQLRSMQGQIEIVRYSPKERNIPNFIGEDALIRFYKDPAEYGNWTGEKQRVITFGQHMLARDRACNFRMFERTTRIFDRHLFGPGNENTGDWCSGKVPFSQLQEEMRTNRVYFYTGTHPASYTLNFMEAWMTGIPIVALGPQHGNASYFPGHDLYEVPELIEEGVTGFVSDNTYELRDMIRALMDDDGLASAISAEGRRKAIEIFGKDTIKQKWKEFLGE